MEKKLYRSTDDKKIAGVCGGMAKLIKLDPTIIRLIWALAIVFWGVGILAYIICAIVIPEEPIRIVDAETVNEE